MKRAFITGITGQDGYHLTELLLRKRYKIFGLVDTNKSLSIKEFIVKFPTVTLIEGSLTDYPSLVKAISLSEPNEIYNLGAISFVEYSFKKPEITANVTGLGPLRVLEAVRTLSLEKDIKFYQASSSEMFGKVLQSPQNERTHFSPHSPYGVAKVYAHQICVNYRETYGMHISCGILFNHEGEYRKDHYVTRKITKGIAGLVNKRINKIVLGNLESRRDWGYAGDYVEAMWLMLQQQHPDDYVIATGKTHSVREFLELAISFAGLMGKVEDYVEIDENLKRPIDVEMLVGDSTKARQILGWRPKVDFENLVKRMVYHDLKNFN